MLLDSTGVRVIILGRIGAADSLKFMVRVCAHSRTRAHMTK